MHPSMCKTQAPLHGVLLQGRQVGELKHRGPCWVSSVVGKLAPFMCMVEWETRMMGWANKFMLSGLVEAEYLIQEGLVDLNSSYRVWLGVAA